MNLKQWITSLLLLLIAVQLIRGAYFLVRDRGQSDQTVRALTWRIGLSWLLLISLVGAVALGWIHPHGLPVKPAPSHT